MAKNILRITTPDGRKYDVPNVMQTRIFYEKLNSQQKDADKHYKFEVIEVAAPSNNEVPIPVDMDPTAEVYDAAPSNNEVPKRGRKPSK